MTDGSDETEAVVIYGAGGFAREVAWLAERAAPRPARPVAFVDDHPTESVLNGLPVLSLAAARERHPTARLVVAVGDPALRARLARRAHDAGFAFATLVDRTVEHSRWVEVAPGAVVCAGTIVTTNVTIGAHAQVNLDCTLGHDVVLEPFATLAPGVHVSGWVRIAEGAYVGTGANIINGTRDEPLVIGAGAVVGAGACVTRSVPPGVTAVGVPAKVLARG